MNEQPSMVLTVYAVLFSTAISALALTLTFTNGRDWRIKYDSLEQRTAALEVKEFRRIAKNPEVLQGALNAYWALDTRLRIAESGRPYKSKPNEVMQCFAVTVPNSQQFYAGL